MLWHTERMPDEHQLTLLQPLPVLSPGVAPLASLAPCLVPSRVLAGIDRLDLPAVDAALLVEPVKDDLGAEILQLRPAAGKRARQVIDHADLQRLAGLLGSCRRERKQRRRNGRMREPPETSSFITLSCPAGAGEGPASP